MSELVLIYDSVTGGFISKQAGSTHIANAAITSALIASGAIGGAHLAAAAILSAQIASGAIGGAHLAAAAILSAQIASGAIGNPHLAAGAIRSGQVGSGQIANIHLAVKPFERQIFLSSPTWVVPGWYADTQTTAVAASGYLYGFPVYVPSLYTYVGINCQVTTQASGRTARMGVYAWSGGGPGALVLDAGTVSMTGVGNKEITISLALDAGWYYLAFVCDGNPTMRSMQTTSAVCPPIGGAAFNVGNMPFNVPLYTVGRTNDPLSGLANPHPPYDGATLPDQAPTIWLRER